MSPASHDGDLWARRFLAPVLLLLLQPCAWSQGRESSEYLKTRDGVRLALDVRFAPGVERAPVALLTTRYGRATEQHPDLLAALGGAGIHFVIADTRGTGASGGSRRAEFSPDEVQDIGELIDWIVAQPWSNGAVASLGNSYAGDTAELAVATGRTALRAALVRHSEFDVYRDLAFPGGVRNDSILRLWGDEAFANDLGVECLRSIERCAQMDYLKPAGPRGIADLRAALQEHQINSHPDRDTRALQFIDDTLPSGIAFERLSAAAYLPALRASAAAVQYWGSWMDAGTADSALTRYGATPKAPVEVFLAPWTHGGRGWADPLGSTPQDGPLDRPRQLTMQLDFLRRALEGKAVPARTIHYFPLGGDGWLTANAWPPVGTQTRTWFLCGNRRLRGEAPEAGEDAYEVDFTATSGTGNRWFTQLGGRPVDYGDRRDQDRRLIVYTSEPLSSDLELAGYPNATLRIVSSAADAALFVYLEDVAPDGRVSYLTEGQLRLIHRSVVAGAAPSFRRADAQAVVPGAVLKLSIRLMPVAAHVRRGHALRLAIAGHDAGTFARHPQSGAVSFSIQRGGPDAARLELPVRRSFSFTAHP